MKKSTDKLFWKHVDTSAGEDGCWLWKGGIHQDGYGAFRIGEKPMKAHRVSYILNVGPIPEGMIIMHTCDQRACVNPKHLRLGTQRDNVLDMIAKGRNRDFGVQRFTGQNNSMNKLDHEKAQEIRDIWNRNHNKKMISKIFGITPKTVQLIIERKTWR